MRKVINAARAKLYGPKVIEAARGWLEDRIPRDSSEIRLVIALYEAFPDDFTTRERCCGLDECDECPSRRELRQRINGFREELARRRWEGVTQRVLAEDATRQAQRAAPTEGEPDAG
jgi:hypothetical protein